MLKKAFVSTCSQKCALNTQLYAMEGDFTNPYCIVYGLYRLWFAGICLILDDVNICKMFKPWLMTKTTTYLFINKIFSFLIHLSA